MKKELSIDFVQIGRSLMRGWWLIAISVIVFTGFGVIRTLDKGENIYTAESTVYSISYGSMNDVYTGMYAMQAYKEVIGSSKVSNRAASLLENKNLTGDAIKAMISYEIESGSSTSSNLVTVYADSVDPETAVAVADAVAAAYVIEMNNIIGSDNVQVLDEAEITTVYNSVTMNHARVRLIAFLVGLILPCVVLTVRSIFSTKIISVNDVMQDDGIKVIGVIPNSREV